MRSLHPGAKLPREEEDQTVPRRGYSCHGTVEGAEDGNDIDENITDKNR